MIDMPAAGTRVIGGRGNRRIFHRESGLLAIRPNSDLAYFCISIPHELIGARC